MSSEVAERADSTRLVRRQADEKFCSACGTVLHASAASCTQCGAAQSMSHVSRLSNESAIPLNELVYCSGCASQMHKSAKSCPQCGAPNKAAKTDKSRVTAAILAFILGGLGIHKFYLGDNVVGIVYLLFCWTYIPMIIAFIEAIVYLMSSDETFSEKYVKS